MRFWVPLESLTLKSIAVIQSTVPEWFVLTNSILFLLLPQEPLLKQSYQRPTLVSSLLLAQQVSLLSSRCLSVRTFIFSSLICLRMNSRKFSHYSSIVWCRCSLSYRKTP
jgi:hypothetical protein